MALSGTLDDFSLVDIIQLVELSRKTGTIELRGLQDAEADEGRIFVNEGAVHGAETGDLSGERALYTLFLATNGEFELNEDTDLPPRTVHTSNPFVILEGSSRREAWSRIRGRLPPPQQVLQLVAVPSGAPDEIKLELDKWHIVTMIDGCRSVADIVQHAGMGRQRALQMIAELVDAGLVQASMTASGR